MIEKKKYKYVIGIDPGVNTGLAVWSNTLHALFELYTTTIHKAMQDVRQYFIEYRDEGVFVRVEDARKRKWFGNTGRERLKGAGSVERDCKIWEDFLTDLEIDFEMVHPKNNKTKWDAKAFERVTKFTGRSSQHARDAAFLVFGM